IGEAVALHQREHRRLSLAAQIALTTLAERLVRLFAADVRLVGLNDPALATERAALRRGHGFPDTMAHEPSRLVGDAEHAGDLKRGHAFLAGGDQVRGQEPFVKRDMRTLENRPGANRELVSAVIAKEHAGLGLAAHLRDVIRAAMRAGRA